MTPWPGPPPIAGEHGAWAMLLIPLVLGFAVGRGGSPAALWAAAGMVLLFLARGASIPAAARLLGGRPLPVGYLPRRLAWTAIYTFAAIACFVGVLAKVPSAEREIVVLAAVLPLGLGIAHSVLGLAGRDRALFGEIVGMAGLAAAAPLVAAAAAARLERWAVGAGALALGYFLSSLAFVRAFRRIKETGRLPKGRCLAAHTGIGAGLVALVALRFLPALALASFVPIAVRTAWGLARPPRNLKILGWREVTVAASFVAIAAAAFLAS